jgi:hypothetical protein
MRSARSSGSFSEIVNVERIAVLQDHRHLKDLSVPDGEMKHIAVADLLFPEIIQRCAAKERQHGTIASD